MERIIRAKYSATGSEALLGGEIIRCRIGRRLLAKAFQSSKLGHWLTFARHAAHRIAEEILSAVRHCGDT
jgi:hypothetical protein